jgi:hypothetical protein
MEIDLPESDISCPNRTFGASRHVSKAERARRDSVSLCEPASEMRRAFETRFRSGLLDERRLPKQRRPSRASRTSASKSRGDSPNLSLK